MTPDQLGDWIIQRDTLVVFAMFLGLIVLGFHAGSNS